MNTCSRGTIASGAALYFAEQTGSFFHAADRRWFVTLPWLTEESRFNNYPPFRYYHDNVISPYQSIFDAMWFSILTLTTVGYGDTVRVTASQLRSLLIIYLSVPAHGFGQTCGSVNDDLRNHADCLSHRCFRWLLSASALRVRIMSLLHLTF